MLNTRQLDTPAIDYQCDSQDLQLYAGTFHGSAIVENAAVSRRMLADETAALRRGLGVTTDKWSSTRRG